MTELLQAASTIGLFVAIIIIVVLSLSWFARDVRATGAGLKVDDERTRQVKGRAALYAWVVGVEFITGFVLVILVGSQFPWFPSISATNALVASLLVSVASFLLLQWYLNRREIFR